jgi:hypothetical protein
MRVPQWKRDGKKNKGAKTPKFRKRHLSKQKNLIKKLRDRG